METIINSALQLEYSWFFFACVFILLDVITGVCKGASQHALSSEIMRRGFWHKLATVTALVVAGLVDTMQYSGLDIGFTVPIFAAACGYVCVMELVSICENLKAMNEELAGTRLMGLFNRETEKNNDNSKK